MKKKLIKVMTALAVALSIMGGTVVASAMNIDPPSGMIMYSIDPPSGQPS